MCSPSSKVSLSQEKRVKGIVIGYTLKEVDIAQMMWDFASHSEDFEF